MRKLFGLSLICLSVLAMPAISNAAQLLVPHQYTTISEALSVAKSGDTIHIAAGTYKEDPTGDGVGLVISTSNIEIVGEEGAVLDGCALGNPNSSGLFIPDGTTGVTIRGLTIQNYGFGVVLSGGNKVQANTITGCGTGVLVTENTGIESPVPDPVTIDHNSISDNLGDGIDLGGTEFVNVAHNDVSDNGGVGIYLDFYTSLNTVTHNTAFGNGIVDAQDDSFPTDPPSPNIWAYNKFANSLLP